MATVENLKLAETAQEGVFASQPSRANWLVDQVRRVPRFWWRYCLIFSDALLIFVAFLTAYYLRYQAQLFLAVLFRQWWWSWWRFVSRMSIPTSPGGHG
jgi:hypothetical protein